MRIVVTLPRDRYQLGTLRVFDANGVEVFSCPCLGKADNGMAARNGNPTRDPLKRYGDTPTGTWSATIGPTLGYDAGSKRTYGPYPVLSLKPDDGDCVRAYVVGGRTGILQHGGALNAAGKLRPTNGCIRVADQDQLAVVELLRAAGGAVPYMVSQE